MPAHTFWFVMVNDEQPSLQTASYTKSGAIKIWLDAAGNTWRFWYRHRYRVRRVAITWRVKR